MENVLKRDGFQKHCVYVPQRTFNSFSEKVYEMMPASDKALINKRDHFYEEGDFVIHTPGLHTVEKLKSLKKLFQKADGSAHSTFNIDHPEWHLHLVDEDNVF